MKFIYADDLKSKFSVIGYFYDLEIAGELFNCRSVLEIISIAINDWKKSEPCVVIIMMNPGSSKPEYKDYIPQIFSSDEIMSESWTKDIIPTKPDNAQYQIMRLMLIKNWKHVRVLNLSDLRNGNSGEFSIEFEKAEKLDPSNPHSMVHRDRLHELKTYCSKAPIVIAAWGSTKVLRGTAFSFLDAISNVQGLALDRPWYKYPSPYRKDQKLDWLEKMIANLS